MQVALPLDYHDGLCMHRYFFLAGSYTRTEEMQGGSLYSRPVMNGGQLPTNLAYLSTCLKQKAGQTS